MLCSEHRVFWSVGWNLFSGWRNETEADWQRNIELLRGFTEIEPFYWPETIAERERSQAELDEMVSEPARLEELCPVPPTVIADILHDVTAAMEEDEAAARGDSDLVYRDRGDDVIPF
jgi:hypothetical protein